eukprot:scaffold264744_cov25-Prasinocladus_malaysianus.AAC.1
MKDGHQRANEELSKKRTAASQLETLNDGLSNDLAETKKKLLEAAAARDTALKLRDNLRLELQHTPITKVRRVVG